jgi:putative transposase
MLWARMLAYITGSVDQELLLRNEYLAAENRVLRAQIKGRLLLSDTEKATVAEIAQRLGRKALEELAAVAKPDTLQTWYRKLIANKFDGSRFRQRVGRPRIGGEAARLVVQMAKEKSELGLRSHRGCLGKSRFPAIRSDGGQHSPSAWPLSCS